MACANILNIVAQIHGDSYNIFPPLVFVFVESEQNSDTAYAVLKKVKNSDSDDN